MNTTACFGRLRIAYTVMGFMIASCLTAKAQSFDSATLRLRSWIEPLSAEAYLPGQPAQDYRFMFSLELTEKIRKSELYSIPLTYLLLLDTVRNARNQRFTKELVFEVNPERFRNNPPGFGINMLQDNMVNLLLKTRISGISLFDKLIALGSLALQTSPDSVNILVFMPPRQMYFFNWDVLHPQSSGTKSLNNQQTSGLVWNYAKHRVWKKEHGKAVSDYMNVRAISRWNEDNLPWDEDWFSSAPVSGTPVTGTVSYRATDLVSLKPPILRDTIRERLIRALRRTYAGNDYVIQKCNHLQIEIVGARNLLTRKDNYWEYILISLSTFYLENGKLSYDLLVSGTYHDSGSTYPDRSYIVNKGKLIGSQYDGNCWEFIRSAFSQLSK